MNNYKMVIQYDGGRYRGWQRLGNGDSSIQGKIENVLTELAGEEVQIIGCSRTDAGVHAMEQIANFKIRTSMTDSEIKAYLNKYLPHDISVLHVEAVSDRFHARYNAKDKTYLYKIWNEEHTNPFMRKYSMHIEEKLDISKMREAASHFLGSHDFTAYSNAKSKKKSMVREIYSISIEKEDGFIHIRVKGDGFLYNMVRKIVGTLIEVGSKRIQPKQIPAIIESKERINTGPMAEAGGLYLERVKF